MEMGVSGEDNTCPVAVKIWKEKMTNPKTQKYSQKSIIKLGSTTERKVEWWMYHKLQITILDPCIVKG